MKLSTIMESQKSIVPVVWNYDSLLIGCHKQQWKFFDGSRKSSETDEEAAVRICYEFNLVVEPFVKPYFKKGRSNVSFVMCSFKDGHPIMENWTEWRWLHPDHVLMLDNLYHHDRDIILELPRIIYDPRSK